MLSSACAHLRHGVSAFCNGIKCLVIPREHRLCRLCGASVETPENALLICPESEALSAARVEFLSHVSVLWPEFSTPMDDTSALPALKALMGEKKVLSGLGGFARKVFLIYDEIELQWPAEYIVRKPVISTST